MELFHSKYEARIHDTGKWWSAPFDLRVGDYPSEGIKVFPVPANDWGVTWHTRSTSRIGSMSAVMRKLSWNVVLKRKLCLKAEQGLPLGTG